MPRRASPSTVPSSAGSARTRPLIDVLLPVRGARRTLPFALADILAQRDVEVRVLAIVDAAAPARDAAHGVPDGDAADASRAWLEARARHEPRLVVLRGSGRGAGAALDVGLAAVRTECFAHMEADDRCPPDRLARLHAARDAADRDPFVGPAAVVSRVAQCGARTPGMRRYLDWQNALLSEDDMADARYLEIPALHQTGLYLTETVRAIGGYTPRGPWPLDIDFWMRWFAADRRDELRGVVKLPRVLYRWRQHPGQSTRSGAAGGTHSLEALRACKAHYLTRDHGRHGASPRPLVLASTGRTLEAWRALLAAHDVDLRASVEWRPGQPLPAALLDALRDAAAIRDDRAKARPAAARSDRAPSPLVLAAYGMAPARARLAHALEAAGLAVADLMWIG